MKKIDLILFDLDGTLVDSSQDIANAVNYSLNEMGLRQKSVEEVTSYIGSGVEELIRRTLGQENRQLFDDTLAIFIKYYKNHFVDSSVLYPNVKETLEHFKNKKKSIVTNRHRESAELTLKTFGINEYFNGIVGGDDLGCIKPSSCPLNSMINRLSADKNNTIIVGDMDVDVLAGKNAGVFTCAVTYGIGKREDIVKAGPDFIIEDILQLKDIIE